MTSHNNNKLFLNQILELTMFNQFNLKLILIKEYNKVNLMRLHNSNFLNKTDQKKLIKKNNKLKINKGKK